MSCKCKDCSRSISKGLFAQKSGDTEVTFELIQHRNGCMQIVLHDASRRWLEFYLSKDLVVAVGYMLITGEYPSELLVPEGLAEELRKQVSELLPPELAQS